MATYPRTRVKWIDIYPEGWTSWEYLNRYVHYGPIYTYSDSAQTAHVCYDAVHPGPPYKEGGPLLIEKLINKSVPFDVPRGMYQKIGITEYYIGGNNVCAEHRTQGGLSITAVPLPDTTLTALGTQAWKRAAGRVIGRNMDLNETLAEFRDLPRLLKQVRDGMRSLFKDRKLREATAKEAAVLVSSGYVSLEFAIKPLWSDFFKLLKAQQFAEQRAEYIRQKSGKTRHIAFNVREDVTHDSWNGTTSVQCVTPQFTQQSLLWTNMPRVEYTKTTERIWFEGRFGFYIPIQDTPAWDRSIYLKHGLGVNLSTIGLLRTAYQVTPWSWLLDWYTSVGDMLANAVYIYDYGVFAKYAYIMCERHTVLETDQTLVFKGTAGTFPVHGKFDSQVKQRIEASPFGFGVDMSALSGWQLSILAAIGISRRSWT